MAEQTVQIKKVLYKGKVVYPATILDAIKDPLQKIGEETNVNYKKTLREILAADRADCIARVAAEEAARKAHIGNLGKKGEGDEAVDITVKEYVDAKAAESNASIEEGNGISVASEANVDGAQVYTITNDLTLSYVAPVAAAEGVEAQGAKLVLKDSKDNSFGEIAVSSIIGNGLLKSSSYDTTTGKLTLTFANADGADTTHVVDLTELFDIDDMVIAEDSKDYLEVTLKETETAQAEFGVKIVDPKDATDSNTGLVDAKQVKDYVDGATTDLAVSAEGDSYIDAAVDEEDNKKINVSANIATVEESEDHELSADAENKLLDGSAIAVIEQTINDKIDDAVTDLAVEAEGDEYVSASIDKDNNKKVVVEATVVDAIEDNQVALATVQNVWDYALSCEAYTEDEYEDVF